MNFLEKFNKYTFKLKQAIGFKNSSQIIIGGFSGNIGTLKKIYGDLIYDDKRNSKLIVPNQIITEDMLTNIKRDEVKIGDGTIHQLFTANTTRNITVRLTDHRIVIVNAGAFLRGNDNEAVYFSIDKENEFSVSNP